MNKLPLAKRVLILNMLVEGSSLRSISRVADVSINTVTKLLVDAGETCLALHDETVRGVKASRIQCDEIWSFNYCKQRTLPEAKSAPMDAGDHLYALALFFAHYNFCRQHKSLKGSSPAMAAGVTDALWSVEVIAERIEANRPRPGKRGPYKKRVSAA